MIVNQKLKFKFTSARRGHRDDGLGPEIPVSLKSIGPNATLVGDDREAAVGGLKAQFPGEIDVGGPELAQSLTDLGLIDEYRLYLHPVVLGHGTSAPM